MNLVGPGLGRNVQHLTVQGLHVHWSVLDVHLVLIWLGDVKVAQCVLDPVLVIPCREVFPGMRPS